MVKRERYMGRQKFTFTESRKPLLEYVTSMPDPVKTLELASMARGQGPIDPQLKKVLSLALEELKAGPIEIRIKSVNTETKVVLK